MYIAEISVSLRNRRSRVRIAPGVPPTSSPKSLDLITLQDVVGLLVNTLITQIGNNWEQLGTTPENLTLQNPVHFPIRLWQIVDIGICRRAQLGVTQKTLDEFQVAGFRVYEVTGRMPKTVESAFIGLDAHPVRREDIASERARRAQPIASVVQEFHARLVLTRDPPSLRVVSLCLVAKQGHLQQRP